MKTIAQLLNIHYPLIQGGMANIATGEFAASVSNAGGLGLIGSGGMNADTLREHIQICKSLTDKPFGVNLMLMNPQVEAQAQLLMDEGVKVVTTGAGNPGAYIPVWKEYGAKVLPVVPAVAVAKVAERAGADAVIAEGTESGGHVGELTTMALVPQVCDAVDPARSGRRRHRRRPGSCWPPMPWGPAAPKWAPACWSARSALFMKTISRPS